MAGLIKWGGLAGSVLLVAAAVLDAAGQSEAANGLRTLGGLLGANVPAGEVTSAVLAGASVAKKLWAEYQKVRTV